MGSLSRSSGTGGGRRKRRRAWVVGKVCRFVGSGITSCSTLSSSLRSSVVGRGGVLGDVGSASEEEEIAIVSTGFVRRRLLSGTI